jgi:hypothetical protein
VEAYQKRASALPGFWVEGPSAAVEVGPEFTKQHAEQLLEAMVGLKEAARGHPRRGAQPTGGDPGLRGLQVRRPVWGKTA